MKQYFKQYFKNCKDTLVFEDAWFISDTIGPASKMAVLDQFLGHKWKEEEGKDRSTFREKKCTFRSTEYDL